MSKHLCYFKPSHLRLFLLHYFCHVTLLPISLLLLLFRFFINIRLFSIFLIICRFLNLLNLLLLLIFLYLCVSNKNSSFSCEHYSVFESALNSLNFVVRIKHRNGYIGSNLNVVGEGNTKLSKIISSPSIKLISFPSSLVGSVDIC